MTTFVKEVKRKLRDVYGLKPDRVAAGDDPCFVHVKDGYYPMEIDGITEHVVVVEGRFHFLKKMEPRKK